MFEKISKLLKPLLPPFIYSFGRLIALKLGLIKKSEEYVYKPSWKTIQNGILKNRQIYIDTHDNNWQTDVIEGIYDKFFFDYIKQLNLLDKTIFDIGAHIGLHTLAFAQLVGINGKVYAFEPNETNIHRMKINLSKNVDLGNRIKIINLAISDSESELDFNYSNEIDIGYSSGGFINNADAPRTESDYKSAHFTTKKVKTIFLDNIIKKLNITEKPYIIKMDIEGAEYLAIKGGINFLKTNQPILLIEIHSIYNMLKICKYFHKINYNIELLNKDKDGRCFIVANPPTH